MFLFSVCTLKMCGKWTYRTNISSIQQFEKGFNRFKALKEYKDFWYHQKQTLTLSSHVNTRWDAGELWQQTMETFPLEWLFPAHQPTDPETHAIWVQFSVKTCCTNTHVRVVLQHESLSRERKYELIMGVGLCLEGISQNQFRSCCSDFMGKKINMQSLFQ